MDKIIFITPFFGNTGSEIALFNLIVRLKGFEVMVISRSKGTLSSRLPSHIEFHDYNTFRKNHKKSILLIQLRNKISKSRRSIFEYFLDQVVPSQRALFYVNTLTMPDAIAYLQKRRYKFIVHAHELQHKLNSLRNADLTNIIKGADFIFTSSKTCKAVLTSLGREKDITHIYPGIEVKSITPGLPNARLRETLKFPADAFVIAMSGTVDINKSPETFLEIGKLLRGRGFNIQLLWIGVDNDTAYFTFLQKKMLEYNLSDNCTWVRKLDGQEYYEYLNLADCFILTSRQESFSIVLVEALALGKPVLSFASGGPEEIINDSAVGLIIEDHSTKRMADAIEKLIKKELLFNERMARGRAMDFCIDDIFENWLDLLTKRCLKNS